MFKEDVESFLRIVKNIFRNSYKFYWAFSYGGRDEKRENFDFNNSIA